MNIKSITALALIVLISKPSFAKNNHEHMKENGMKTKPKFSHVDSNNDDVISLEEFIQHKTSQEHIKKLFSNIDRDNDNIISKHEFKEHKAHIRSFKRHNCCH